MQKAKNHKYIVGYLADELYAITLVVPLHATLLHCLHKPNVMEAQKVALLRTSVGKQELFCIPNLS
jgi:hypothetical protein